MSKTKDIPPQVPAGCELRILVVDDDPFNLELMEAQLASRGLTADLARNGVEALRRLEDGGYDLVLLDLHMPGLDGFAVARAHRAREAAGERLPIVAVTASRVDGDQGRCLAAGMDDFAAKPLFGAALDRILARWLPGSLPGRT